MNWAWIEQVSDKVSVNSPFSRGEFDPLVAIHPSAQRVSNVMQDNGVYPPDAILIITKNIGYAMDPGGLEVTVHVIFMTKRHETFLRVC